MSRHNRERRKQKAEERDINIQKTGDLMEKVSAELSEIEYWGDKPQLLKIAVAYGVVNALHNETGEGFGIPPICSVYGVNKDFATEGTPPGMPVAKLDPDHPWGHSHYRYVVPGPDEHGEVPGELDPYWGAGGTWMTAIVHPELETLEEQIEMLKGVHDRVEEHLQAAAHRSLKLPHEKIQETT